MICEYVILLIDSPARRVDIGRQCVFQQEILLHSFPQPENYQNVIERGMVKT